MTHDVSTAAELRSAMIDAALETAAASRQLAAYARALGCFPAVAQFYAANALAAERWAASRAPAHDAQRLVRALA